ncbi:hypothetical protein R6Q59_011322 [Mikania micrantha]
MALSRVLQSQPQPEVEVVILLMVVFWCIGLPVKANNARVILNGGQKVTFVKPDGYFTLDFIFLITPNFLNNPLQSHNVHAGTTLLQLRPVADPGFFSNDVTVRVDVSARNPGKVQAALTENRRGLNELGLEPLREEQYYESNVTDDWIYDGGDVLDAQTNPEEIRKAQEEMRNQGFPSLANLMPGGGRSNEVSVWTHK